MDNIYDLDLLKILPSSISDDKNVQAIAKALTPELQSVSHDTREALIISRIDELPEPVIDRLGWQWHVDFYDPSLPLDVKRVLVKSSIPWHRKKGTLWAVKQILRDLGVEPVIREWFDINGARPYTFAIDATYTGNPAEIFSFLGGNTEKLLRLAIDVTKPVRADLLYLVLMPDMPELDPLTHGCRYDYCAYGHGLLPGLEIEISAQENGIEGKSENASLIEMGLKTHFPIWIAWDCFRYGDVLTKTYQETASLCAMSFFTDRDEMEGYGTWDVDKEWSAQTWLDNDMSIGGWLFVQVYPVGCAVYGYTIYDGLSAIESRYWHTPTPDKYDAAEYDSRTDTAEYRPILEYSVVNDYAVIDLSGILSPECETGYVRGPGAIGEGDINGDGYRFGLVSLNSVAWSYLGFSGEWDGGEWDEQAWETKRPAISGETNLIIEVIEQ